MSGLAPESAHVTCKEHHLFQILVEANICGGDNAVSDFTHMMFLIMFSPDFMVEKYGKKPQDSQLKILSLLLLMSHFFGWLLGRIRL